MGEAYKSELSKCYGITFNRLLCLNNMPVKRYSDYLNRKDQLEEYMNLLLESFNPGAVDGLMCRNLFSIGWDGRIFDCDFNQQLDLPLATSKKKGADEDKVVDKVADEKKRVVATRAGPGITVFDVDSL